MRHNLYKWRSRQHSSLGHGTMRIGLWFTVAYYRCCLI